MKILAIDTATRVTTVALMDDERELSEITINSKKNHSEKLMVIIEEVICSAGCTINDVDVFACSVGPGSFTGLRIAIATIKGLAQSLDKPVIGVSTLEALAFNMYNSQDIICPVIDAQRDEVYTGMYRWINQDIILLSQEKVMTVTELLEEIYSRNSKVVFLGDATDKISQEDYQKYKDFIQIAPISHSMPKATSIAHLALTKWRKGIVQNFSELQPNYIRKSQAEVQLELKQKKL